MSVYAGFIAGIALLNAALSGMGKAKELRWMVTVYWIAVCAYWIWRQVDG